MEFKVRFKSNKGYAVDLESQYLGLSWLDRVRQELDLPHLEGSRVADYLPSHYHLYVSVAINEEQARASGRFDNTSRVTAKIPDKYLNRFYGVGVRVDRDPETGEIKEVSPIWKLDKEALVEAWLADGAPLEWGFDEDEDSLGAYASRGFCQEVRYALDYKILSTRRIIILASSIRSY